MPVPYIFALTPGGSSIPLAHLDANFAYLTSGPTLSSLTVSGQTTLNGATAINGPLTIDGVTIDPSGITGTGALVLNNNPTLINPILGTPASGILTNCTGLPVSTGISGLGAGVSTFLSIPSSANLAAMVTDETGTGSLVFSNSPSLVTPNLGTPSAGNLTNCSGYPAASLTGTLPISLGGTGATSQAAALNNLLPTQSAPQAGYVLTTNGLGGVSWTFNASAGTVSSVGLDPSTTGLTVNGGTTAVNITTTGTFTLGGVLATTNGGTGTATLGTGLAAAFPIAVNTSGGIITYASFAPAAGKQLTIGNTVTLNGVDGNTYTLPPSSNSLGYLEVPQNAQVGGYVTVLSDSGKFINFITGGSTITIAANASVAYPVGTVITFVNVTGSSVSIACGDTMTLAGIGSTGTRTLSTAGLATALKVGANSWLISGTGLT